MNDDLIYRLAHHLGVALEYEWLPEEIVALWDDALDDLGKAKEYLLANNLPVPGVVENILKKVGGLQSPA